MRKRPNAKKPNDRTPCCFPIDYQAFDHSYPCTRPNLHSGRHVHAKYKTIPINLTIAKWAEKQIEKGYLTVVELPVIIKEATNSKDYENVGQTANRI